MKEKKKDTNFDNGAAYNEYMGRNQSKLAFVENSKRKADIYKQMVPIFADPTKRSLMLQIVGICLYLWDSFGLFFMLFFLN